MVIMLRSISQIFLKVAEDTGVDAEIPGKMAVGCNLGG